MVLAGNPRDCSSLRGKNNSKEVGNDDVAGRREEASVRGGVISESHGATCLQLNAHRLQLNAHRNDSKPRGNGLKRCGNEPKTQHYATYVVAGFSPRSRPANAG